MPAAEPSRRWRRWVAPATLAVVLGVVYALTLRPGLGTGDTADLQYQSAVLGICHDPGYRLQVLAAWLFSRLPLGPDVAWRVNCFSAISGIVGCLALYGAVMRITGSTVAALIAPLLLGFSSIYWAFSITAEVYVFYSAFLLMGTYFLIRFVQQQRNHFLAIGCLLLGVCVADRPSELFILPAFAGLWLGFWKTLRINGGQVVLAAASFVLPFLLTVTYHVIRDTPESLHNRGNALRDELVSPGDDDRNPSFSDRVRSAIRFSLGLRWTEKTGITTNNLARGASRYARLLSGVGALDKRPADAFQWERGLHGTSIGIVGALFSLLGMILWRRQPGWPLLGLGLFAGNLLFYFWYYVEHDGITFTIPGQAGLSLLAGLGIAGQPGSPSVRWRRVTGWVGIAAAGFLLVTNWRLVDLSGTGHRALDRRFASRLRVDVPRDSVFIAAWGDVNRYRYLLHVQAQRHDVLVMEADVKLWRPITEALVQLDRPTFLIFNYQSRDRRMMKLTPPTLRPFGVYCVHWPAGLPAQHLKAGEHSPSPQVDTPASRDSVGDGHEAD